jgi:hypothetical protein
VAHTEIKNFDPPDEGRSVTTGRLLPKPSTQPSEPNPYEQQNQALLQKYGLHRGRATAVPVAHAHTRARGAIGGPPAAPSLSRHD